MKKQILRAIAVAASCAVVFSTTAIGISADTIVSEQDMAQVESVLMTELCMELGYASVEAFLSTVTAEDIPSQSRIKDLNGDNKISAADAQFVLLFVKGKRMYNNSYTDLDATGDYIINEADAVAYLEYYTYHMSHGLSVPFSSSNGPRTVDYAFENRSYWRYDCLTHKKDATPYTVNAPTSTNTSDTVFTASQFNNNTSVMSFTGTADQRFVQTFSGSGDLGTGFIIGAHTIATAAHCVYGTNDNFSFSGVRAFDYTYDKQGNVVATSFVNLTPLSVHVPVNYGSKKGSYDYALIEVEEDLTKYGYCSLGMIIDGIDTLFNYNSNGLPYVDESGAEIKAMGIVPGRAYDPPIGSLYLPGTTYGQLFRIYNEYYCTTNADHINGESGGALFVKDSSGEYDTVFGIHKGAINSDSGVTGLNYSMEIMITRPVLQFLLSNPMTVYDN